MQYAKGEYALMFKALSDETRLKIIGQLGAEELCACNILESLHITQPTLSYHMKLLVENGLVNSRKDGSWMKYTINNKRMEELREFLEKLKTHGGECCPDGKCGC